MYGRIRFSCNKSNIKARSIVKPYEDDLVIAIFDAYFSHRHACFSTEDWYLFLNAQKSFEYEKYQFYNKYDFNALWPVYENNNFIGGNYYSTTYKCDGGQFTGVLNYTELNLIIT